MEKIKSFVVTRFEVLFAIFMVVSLSLFLLMLRLKITHSFFYLFLVWNLFLAAVPMIITFYLSHKKRLKKYALASWFLIWLLFLPNAPYIVTDAIHLRLSSTDILLFDSFLIGIFAFAGLFFYCVSLRDMEQLLENFVSPKKIKILVRTLPFLVGLGIYLGRFLRWNSWDIIQAPQILMTDIFEIIRFPLEHKEAWITTIGFGIGLKIIYLLYKRFHFSLRDM
jgi:uncharacterized membrane protein